jgi:alkylation response protein AidB-like acyl-CoA dehydrogenase
MENGQPRIGPSGHPEAIMAMMPASEVEFLDNWQVIGMRGTDSCDVRAKDVFVPKSRTFSLMAPPATCFDTPVARLPLRVALAFPHCALALGIAQGAIDDITALAATKRAAMNPTATLSGEPVFRFELGRHIMRLTAAKALVDLRAQECWKAGEERRELTPNEILTTRLMANHVTDECVKIVDWAYTTAGSSSVYDTSSLQVRFRDIHVATQHASCHTDPYRLLAAVALGEQLTPQELF